MEIALALVAIGIGIGVWFWLWTKSTKAAAAAAQRAAAEKEAEEKAAASRASYARQGRDTIQKWLAATAEWSESDWSNAKRLNLSPQTTADALARMPDETINSILQDKEFSYSSFALLRRLERESEIRKLTAELTGPFYVFRFNDERFLFRADPMGWNHMLVANTEQMRAIPGNQLVTFKVECSASSLNPVDRACCSILLMGYKRSIFARSDVEVPLVSALVTAGGSVTTSSYGPYAYPTDERSKLAREGWRTAAVTAYREHMATAARDAVRVATFEALGKIQRQGKHHEFMAWATHIATEAGLIRS